jgi:signal transduction histidine kinase/ligand-binding sensor domain-containing protein/AraC-like DNA-binding protein
MFYLIFISEKCFPDSLIKIKKLLILLSIKLIFFSSLTYSNDIHVRFNQITSNDGLSQNTVDYILQDRRGFIWFATWNGLNRYDGYSFKIYKADKKENSISNNYIHSICEDLEGNLWIGTENGLNILDVITDHFITLINNPSDTNSISGNNITEIVCDKNGIIWVGTYGQGLNKIKRIGNKEFKVARFKNNPGSSGSLSNDIVNTLYLDKEDNLWIGTNKGLNVLDKETNRFKSYLHNQNPKNSISHNSILSICEDSFGYLWTGTWYGLNKINKNTGRITQYYFDKNNPSSISNSVIKAIKEDVQGNLIIGTLNGLNKYNREFDSFYHFPVNKNDDYSLSNEFINCIATDNQGNIWIGTDMGGVNMYNVFQKKFGYIVHDPFSKNSLSSNIINSIFEGPSKLWIGTAGSGLNCYDKNTGKFYHYKNIPDNNRSISGDYVSAISKDTDNNLLIGTWGNGLNQIVIKSNQISFERLIPENGWNNINNISISCIYSDSNIILLGGINGLEIVDIKHKKFIPIANNPEWKNKINDVKSIIKDKQNYFWIGTRKGLYSIDKNNLSPSLNEDEITYYSKNTDELKSLPDNYITTLCEDKQGNIWIGTFGNGISKMQIEDSIHVSFTNYNEKDGLSNNVIYSILIDENGNLWMSTDFGLSKFDPELIEFKNFYLSDGLQNNQYYWGAAFKGNTEILYFGGMKGVNYFNPNDIIDNNIIPKVTITDFRVFNKSVPVGTEDDPNSILKQDISVTPDIELSYKDNVFSFEFSALTYFQSSKINYAYKMEGVDKDWVLVPSTQRFASYTNLKGGDYTFYVKASNSDGVMSNEPTKLTIHIAPPFWETILFKVLGLSIIVLLIILYFKYRTRVLVIQKRSLELIIEKRTNDITIQKEQLALQNKEITEQRDKLIDLNKKVQQVNQLKLRFFTNISHEFRTPLTLIAGPVKNLLSSLPGPEETRASLLIINRNVQRLIHLINQLLDFRKVETGKLELKVSKGDLGTHIKNIFSSFEQLAVDAQINYKYTKEPCSEEQWFDHEKIENVLLNLLSNAFKHTPPKGSIYLSLKFKDSDTKNNHKPPMAEIKVTDTGNGIPPAHINNIFKRFYQINTPENIKHRGSGIGLSLTKELVNAHHGNISAESKVGKGTTFTVCIPYLKDSFQPKEITARKNELDRNIIEQKISPVEIFEPEIRHYNINKPKANKKQSEYPLILIVEDNYDLRTFIINNLTQDYSILEAENGKDAYEIAKAHNPSIIISDIMMPVMDGLELCTRIKNNLLTCHIPIILLTARSLVENWIEGLEIGADDYMPKPFDINLLNARIKNILESRKKLRKHFVGEVETIQSDVVTTNTDKVFLGKAIKIVEENIGNSDFGVKDFVDEMCVSHSLLHKKLTVLVNQSAGDFITTLRLKKSVKLLQNSGKNISEVAYEVGFNDPKYFSQKFKRYFGVLPSDYSKQSK